LNRPLILYALIFLMVAFWSGNYIVGKIALRELPPLLVAGLRIGFAGLMILPFWAWQWFRESACATKTNPVSAGVGQALSPAKSIISGHRVILRLLLLGVFGVTLNQLFFIVGLSRTSVAHAAILIGLTPVQVLILACLRGQERMTFQRAAGMAIALAGVALLKAFEPAAAAGATWLGDLFTFLAGTFFAIFTVFGKEVTKLHSAVTVNAYAYVGGAVALAPVTLWEISRHPLAHISAAAWLAVLYMALFSSVIAYLIYYYALTHVAASRVSAFSYLQPVFATAMGAAILREPVGAPVIAGGLVILSGVYLVERG